MRNLFLVLLISGCTRMHAVTPDANGGVYFVSQKHTLGIGGKQTLMYCATPDSCGTVVASNELADLGPATASVRSADNNLDGLLGGLLGDDFDGMEGLFSGENSRAGRYQGPVDCPADAVVLDSPIPEGTRVSLVAIHPDDAYAGSEFESELPITGTVDGDLHGNQGCWAGGGFNADSGESFYFYKAAFRFE